MVESELQKVKTLTQAHFLPKFKPRLKLEDFIPASQNMLIYIFVFALPNITIRPFVSKYDTNGYGPYQQKLHGLRICCCLLRGGMVGWLMAGWIIVSLFQKFMFLLCS